MYVTHFFFCFVFIPRLFFSTKKTWNSESKLSQFNEYDVVTHSNFYCCCRQWFHQHLQFAKRKFSFCTQIVSYFPFQILRFFEKCCRWSSENECKLCNFLIHAYNINTHEWREVVRWISWLLLIVVHAYSFDHLQHFLKKRKIWKGKKDTICVQNDNFLFANCKCWWNHCRQQE